MAVLSRASQESLAIIATVLRQANASSPEIIKAMTDLMVRKLARRHRQRHSPVGEMLVVEKLPHGNLN